MHAFGFREFGLKTPIHAPEIGVLGQNRGKGWCDVDPQQTHSYFWGLLLLCHFWRIRSRNATVRVQTDKQTEFIICLMLYAIAMGQITTR